MKKLILLFVAMTIFCTSFIRLHCHEPNLQLSLSYTGKWADKYYGRYYSYHALITNKGSETIYFINATCSFADAFTTNHKKAGILNRNNCYKNGILCYSIAPGSSHEYDVDVRPLPGWDDTTTFSIGFIWVDPLAEQDDITRFHDQIKNSSHNVIWSERLKLR